MGNRIFWFSKRKFALRYGQLAEGQAHYSLTEKTFKKLCNGTIKFEDLEEKDFVFVDHEVSEVKWLDFEKCYQDVKENKINHCIYIEELDIVKKYLRVQ